MTGDRQHEIDPENVNYELGVADERRRVLGILDDFPANWRTWAKVLAHQIEGDDPDE